MKSPILRIFCLIFICSSVFSQEKIDKFYTEKGEELSRNEFYEPPGNNEYLAVYIEKDSITVGIRVQKEKYGRLEDSTFNALRLYLNSLKPEKIGEDDLIVINFLTGVTLEEQNRNARSPWNIFEGNYIRKLKKVADVSHYWLSTLPKEKLKYFHSNRIDWKQDKQGMIPEVFSPYGLKYGYYIIIRPNGDYYYEIGEYSKFRVWEKTKEINNLTLVNQE